MSIPNPPNAPLLSVEELKVFFSGVAAPIRAVDGVGFEIPAGETVALVGESGSGKSVTALSLTRLLGVGARIISGRVIFSGCDLIKLPLAELTRLRGAAISYIFQDPSNALNPVFRSGWQVAEALKLHGKSASRKEVEKLLAMVGLPDTERCWRAYPHELSGGMQQRVMIAMALACHPRLLIADEPTTALDVTVQAQILDLLTNLQKEIGMAVLLITHNLGLVAGVASHVNVMYAGRIVEQGPADVVLCSPSHPYTRGLLAAVPRMTSKGGEVKGIAGSVPHPAHLPEGCKFHPRCPQADEKCRRAEPEWSEVSQGHKVLCHYWK